MSRRFEIEAAVTLSEPEKAVARKDYVARREARVTDADNAQRAASADAWSALGVDSDLVDCLWMGAAAKPVLPDDHMPPFDQSTKKIIDALFKDRGRGSMSVIWSETLWWLCWRRRTHSTWDQIPLKAPKKRLDFAADNSYFDLVLQSMPQMLSLGEIERAELEALCLFGKRRGERRRANKHRRTGLSELAA